MVFCVCVSQVFTTDPSSSSADSPRSGETGDNVVYHTPDGDAYFSVYTEKVKLWRTLYLDDEVRGIDLYHTPYHHTLTHTYCILMCVMVCVWFVLALPGGESSPRDGETL